jgi:hypothetical protein
MFYLALFFNKKVAVSMIAQLAPVARASTPTLLQLVGVAMYYNPLQVSSISKVASKGTSRPASEDTAGRPPSSLRSDKPTPLLRC